MRSIGTRWPALLVACAAGLAHGGSEDPATARERQLNAEGIAKVQAGQHLEAIQRFKEAEQLVARHAHDCNIGQAYLQLGRLPQAWLFFERCEARMGPNPDAWLKALRADLDGKLGKGPYVRVVVHIEPSPAGLVVPSFAADEVWRVDGSRALWLPQGSTRLAVSVGGIVREARDVLLESSAPIELAIHLVPPAHDAVSARRHPRWALAPLGAGVVAAGVGGYFLLQGNAAAGRIDALGTPAEAPSAFSLASHGESQSRLGLWLGGGGVALAATGMALFLLLDEPAAAPVAVVGPEGMSVGLAGSF